MTKAWIASTALALAVAAGPALAEVDAYAGVVAAPVRGEGFELGAVGLFGLLGLLGLLGLRRNR